MTIKIDQLADAIINAPGATVEMLSVVPASGFTTTAADYEDIDSSISATFSVPVAGKYVLTFVTSGYATGATAAAGYRLVFDAAGTPQYVGEDDPRWQIFTAGNPDLAASLTALAEIELSAGEHTVKVQWKRASGSGTWNAQTDVSFVVRGTLVAGSGAGGVLSSRELLGAGSLLIDTDYVSPWSPLEVTDLTQTITVAEDEQVMVVFAGHSQQTGAGVSTSFVYLFIDDEGTSAANATFYTRGSGFADWERNNLSFCYLTEPLSAGTHTFRIYVAKGSSGEQNWTFVSPVLHLVQYRGGLVPIQLNGTEVVGQPRALNFIGGGVYEVTEGYGANAGIANIELNQNVTAPGTYFRVTADQFATAKILLGSGYTQFFPDTTGSTSFTVPNTGRYRVTFSGIVWGDAGAGTAQIEMRINEGESDEVLVGGDTDDTWRIRVHNGELSTFTLVGEVDLVAGDNDLKVYGKIIAGTGVTFFGTATAQNQDMVADFTLISGSGAGGTLADTVQTTSEISVTGVLSPTPSWTAIGALDIDVDVSEGENLLITLNAGGRHTSGSYSYYYVRVLVNGVEAGRTPGGVQANATYWNENLSFSCVATDLAAGTAEVRVEAAKYDAASASWLLQTDSKLSVVRFRGGLVPIRQDGETKVDKPAALDFRGAGIYTVDNYGGTAVIELNQAITGPGEFETFMSLIPGGTYTTTSSTFVDIDVSMTDTFTVSNTGTYAIWYTVSAHNQTSYCAARYQLVFDSGETNEQTIGNDDVTWQLLTHASGTHFSKTLLATVTLTEGTHTVKPQWKRVDGSGTLITDGNDPSIVVGQFVSGSGAGGILVQKEAGTALPQTIDTAYDTTGYEDITGCEITQAVSDGDRLLIAVQAWGLSSGSPCSMRTVVDLSGPSSHTLFLSQQSTGSTSVALEVGGSVFTPELVAGTYTIKFQAAKYSTQANWTLEAANIDVSLFRGGLVPIRMDGETIVDKPAALDFIGAGVYEVENSGGTARIELNQAITAIGARVEFLRQSSTSTDSLSSASFVDMGVGSEVSGTFEIESAGLYSVEMSIMNVDHVSNWAESRYQIIFDEGTSEEQTIGVDDPTWALTGNTQNRISITMRGEIQLAVGSHTVQVQWKRENGTGTPTFTANYSSVVIVGHLVTGSGAGGSILSSEVLTSDFVTPSEDNWHVVTGLSNTFDASSDETVYLNYVINCGHGALSTFSVAYRVDGGSWVILGTKGGQYDETFSGSQPIENLSAGEHTVDIGVYTDFSTFTVFGGSAWYGTNRYSYAFITQYRGGLVPIRQDGVTKIDKPAALDFRGAGIYTVDNYGGTAVIELNQAITAPGTRIEITDQVGASDIQFLTTGTIYMPTSGSGSVSFNVPVAGTYKITHVLNTVATAQTTGYIKLVFDEGTADEQEVGGSQASPDSRWQWAGVTSTYICPSFVGEVELSVGDHTLVAYGYSDGNDQYIQGDTAKDSQDPIVELLLVTGSGAGGTLDTEMSDSSSPVTMAVADTEYALQSGTIDCVEGDNVLVTFTGWYYQGTATGVESLIYLRVKIDGVTAHTGMTYKLGASTSRGASDRTNVGFSTVLENLSAGSHTIEITAVTAPSHADTGGRVYFSPGHLLRFRGGLVPVRQDGETKVATPAAFDFIGAGVYEVTNSGGTARIELNQAITAVGDYQELVEEPVPTTTISLTNSYTAILPRSGSLSFTSNAGTYKLEFMCEFWFTGSDSVIVQVIIDEGESTEQTIGENEYWQKRSESGGSYEFAQFSEIVTLTEGSHTVTVYAKEDGSGDIQMVGTTPVYQPKLSVQMITGSGAGGTLLSLEEFTGQTVDISNDTTGAWYELDTIDVTGSSGEEFLIHVDLTWRANASNTLAFFRLYDETSGEVVGQHTYCHSQGSSDQQNVSFRRNVTLPGLGTHTYRLETAKEAGGQNYKVALTNIVSEQYRGGLVPVRDDSVTVVDKPAAIDFVGPNVSVINNGGTATVNYNGVAEGLEYAESVLGGNVVLTANPSYVDLVDIDVTTSEGELVIVHYQVKGVTTGSAATMLLKFEIDGTPETDRFYNESTSGISYTIWADGAVVRGPFSAGTHNIKITGAYGNTGVTVQATTTKIGVSQYKGGYITPENIPVISGVNGYLFNYTAAPGAASELRLTMNNGVRYKAVSPMAMDISSTGFGGRETSASLTDGTWYYSYAVPDQDNTGYFGIVLSDQHPGLGPIDYTAWRYLGAVYYIDSTDKLRKVTQIGNKFDYPDALDETTWLYDSGSGGATEITPTADAWYSFSVSGAGPGGGLQRDLRDTVPTSAVQVDVSANMDTDSGEVYDLFIESGEVLYTPSHSAATPGAFLSCDLSQRHANRALIPLYNGDMQFRWATGNAGPLSWLVSARGYVDGYLTNLESQKQALYVPDSLLPQLTWIGDSQVDIAALPSQPSIVKLTLQDEKERSFNGTLSFDPSLGAVDGGLDTGSESASTWYYLYLVPKSGDDDFLTVRGSENPPYTGPSGYSNYKYIGAVRNNSSSVLKKFYHSGDRFRYAQQTTIENITDPSHQASYGAIDMSGMVPATAFDTSIGVKGYNTSGYVIVQWSVDGSLLYREIWISTADENYDLDIPCPGQQFYQRFDETTGGGNLQYWASRCRGWIDGYLGQAADAGNAHYGAQNLDQAYNGGRTITVDEGPVILDGYAVETLSTDGYIGLSEISDPTELAGKGLIYTSDDSGDTELFYKDDSGNTVQITKDGLLNADEIATHNTLDQSYDEGGAGAGRTITVDAGAVTLDGYAVETLSTDGYIGLSEISDPSALAGKGLIYTMDDSGDTELFYKDDSGNAVQITIDGGLNVDPVTLDQAYNGGRTITVDSGPVVFDASGGDAIEIDGNLEFTGAGTAQVVGSVADGASAIVHTLDSENEMTTAGAKLLSVQNQTNEVFYVDKDGYGVSDEELIAANRLRAGASGSYIYLDAFGGGTGLVGRELVTESTAHALQLRSSRSSGDGNISIALDADVNAASIHYDHKVASFGYIDSGDSRTELVTIRGDGSIYVESGDLRLLDGYLVLEEIADDPPEESSSGIVYTKDIDGYSELNYVDNFGNVVQLTSRGSANFGVLNGYDELDPTATDGTETSLTLTNTPVGASALDVFRNGIRMRKVSTLGTDKDEFTWDGDTTITFLASGSANGWYYANYIYNIDEIESAQDELDPTSTNGTETTLTLTYTPRNISSLNVYRNGIRMRRVTSLGTDKDEFTWDGDKTITFVASGSSGGWYYANYLY